MKKGLLNFLKKTARILLLVLIFFFAFLGFARVRGALLSWNYLFASGVRSHPLYLVISGALWGIIGSAVFILLVIKHPLARLAILICLASLSLGYWLERFIFYVSEMKFSHWQIPLFINAALAIFVVGLTAIQKH